MCPVLLPTGRLENRELQHFLQEEHHVFFQGVLRDGLVDSTDEAIIAELRSLAEISFTDGVALLTADKDFAAAVKEVTAAGTWGKQLETGGGLMLHLESVERIVFLSCYI